MTNFIEVTNLDGTKSTVPIDKIILIDQNSDNTAYIALERKKCILCGFSTKESYEDVIAKLSE